MASTIILSDNGASSGSAGLKETGGNDGVLILQTTTSGGTATNAVYVDTSQNIGVGTSSPAAKLDVTATMRALSSAASAPASGKGVETWYDSSGDYGRIASYDRTGGAYKKQYIDGLELYLNSQSSGNVGIGTSSPQSTFQVGSINSGTSESTNKGLVMVQSAPSTIDSAGGLEFKTSSSGSGYGWKIGGLNAAGDPFVIGNRANSASFTERARIDSSGNLLVGTTSTSNSTNTFFKTSGANLPALCVFKNSGNTSTDNAFVVTNGAAGGTNSFIVLANGNALNTNNSYGAISDVRLKENIEDATPKLADLMQVKIRQYNLIADEEKQKQLGVVADELETVFPAMVTEDNDGFKNVKYSVFVPMLIKAIQEQQAIIQTLTQRVEALEGAK